MILIYDGSGVAIMLSCLKDKLSDGSGVAINSVMDQELL
jgi:hypothetical protein